MNFEKVLNSPVPNGSILGIAPFAAGSVVSGVYGLLQWPEQSALAAKGKIG
jgi:hypothetical protein